MNEPFVTVVEHARVLGWPFNETWPDGRPKLPRESDRAYVLPLSKALTRQYKKDAHFMAYATSTGYRLKTDALAEGVSVKMGVIVLDMDCNEVHGKGKPVPMDWRADVREKCLAVITAHPGPYFYETRGGARLVYRLPVPSLITDDDDRQQWRQDYATTVAYMKRTFGLEADPACSDWTRLFRLPHALRTPGGQCENWPTAGNPKSVAPLWFTPTAEDVEEAHKILPKAFDEIGQKTVADFTQNAGDGRGLYFHALRNRGYLIKPFKRDWHLIRCPNEASHSSGKTGDTSTILMPPSGGGVLGNIACLHGHCQHLRVKDWLKFFSKAELEQARIAAGIADRRAA